MSSFNATRHDVKISDSIVNNFVLFPYIKPHRISNPFYSVSLKFIHEAFSGSFKTMCWIVKGAK